MKRIGVVSIAMCIATSVSLAADVKAGQAAYDRACKSCHGADGTPNPNIVKALKVDMKALGSAEVQAQSDAMLGKDIIDGIGKMRPATSVTGKTVDDVVAYMRTLKK